MINVKSRKKIKKKNLLIVIVIVLTVLSYLTVNNHIYIEKYFRDLFFFSFDYVPSKNFTVTLKDEVEKENESMKKLLNIDFSLTDYDYVYATVIERKNDFFLDEITINKGEKDGIREGMAVVDYNGLVGTIEKTTFYTSVVKLITNSSKYNNISVKVVGEEILNKILTVSNNKMIIEGIDKDSKVKVGDKIVTSGLTTKFPSGIIIGTIIEIEKDYYDTSNVATVFLASDIDNLRFVAVLKRNAP